MKGLFQVIKQKLRRRNGQKKLRERHVLQIMREDIKGDRYRLNEGERQAYSEIFGACPYAANVFLMIMELGKGKYIDLPENQDERVVHIEHLVDIRFSNPWGWHVPK
ncbi:MAG: hypothetical protein D8M57_13110 [Candidatus Scalindua sp. AMX11]|nr:MAG: hypothetical protein DWQ00_11980 [Candidatus Scalindua sp.]NOG83788.1 hypothetical protein [Planctomycetota bacterium]RZV82944.1 MAG: hypothetical protein EX341_09135 [Candidatus Scalindua sp. SCAELEC01]TDE64434.1 MAG: hypothetical protein D8M57_13110 [Candidatus Scalindua sp. AMX11]GJQ59760.1 MAG: hypothetical protein SCALA701_25610 [Candidatus Scalindua sp.]